MNGLLRERKRAAANAANKDEGSEALPQGGFIPPEDVQSRGGAPAKPQVLWGVAKAEWYRQQARKLKLENDAAEEQV